MAEKIGEGRVETWSPRRIAQLGNRQRGELEERGVVHAVRQVVDVGGSQLETVT
jgi:hypothetical protein